MSPERQKQRTLQTLLEATLALAAERPLLMVVEDLHWMDPTTMELLAMLSEQLPTVRLFALFTARSHFQPSWPSHAHVTSLMLTRLTRRQTEEMVQRVAGGKQLPAEVVKQIVAKTDGVPLFVEELTKMVLESGLVQTQEDRYQLTGPLPPLAIPTTLQDSLTARLDRLATAKAIAQLGAILGREFSYAMLQAISASGRAHSPARAGPIGRRRVPLPARRSTRGELHLQACADPRGGLPVSAPEYAPPISRAHRTGHDRAILQRGRGPSRIRRHALHGGGQLRCGCSLVAKSRAARISACLLRGGNHPLHEGAWVYWSPCRNRQRAINPNSRCKWSSATP